MHGNCGCVCKPSPLFGLVIAILVGGSATTLCGAEDPSPNQTTPIAPATTTGTVRHAFGDSGGKHKDARVTTRMADRGEGLASGLQAAALSKAPVIHIVPGVIAGIEFTPPVPPTPPSLAPGTPIVRPPFTLFQPSAAHVRMVGSKVVVDWTGLGILQYAPAITGPWSNVYFGASPYSSEASSAMGFYRFRGGN